MLHARMQQGSTDYLDGWWSGYICFDWPNGKNVNPVSSNVIPKYCSRPASHDFQPPDCIPENFPTYLTKFHCLPKKSEAQKTFITVSSFIPLKVNFSFPRIWTILRLSKDFLIWLNCHEHDTFVLTILSFVEWPPQKGHIWRACVDEASISPLLRKAKSRWTFYGKTVAIIWTEWVLGSESVI